MCCVEDEHRAAFFMERSHKSDFSAILQTEECGRIAHVAVFLPRCGATTEKGCANGDLALSFVEGLRAKLDGIAIVDLHLEVTFVLDLVRALFEQLITIEVIQTQRGDIFAQSGIYVFFFAGVGIDQLDAHRHRGLAELLNQSNLSKHRLKERKPRGQRSLLSSLGFGVT